MCGLGLGGLLGLVYPFLTRALVPLCLLYFSVRIGDAYPRAYTLGFRLGITFRSGLRATVGLLWYVMVYRFLLRYVCL